MESVSKRSQNLFEVALHAVRDGLSEADKRHFKRFANHHEMMADIRHNVCKYTGNSRLRRCAEKVASFANGFAPFFDVIGVFVQVKPEYAAVLWGTILFIFKIGTNLVNFLERVSGMYEEISLILPQYTSWYEIWQNSPQLDDGKRLAQAMGFVYHDVIEFSMHIYIMFSRQEGSRIKRVLLGADLLLRPFESRFGRLIDRLSMHRTWFEAEMNLQQHSLSIKSHKDFQQHVHEQEKLNEGQAQRDHSRLLANNSKCSHSDCMRPQPKMLTHGITANTRTEEMAQQS
ncbi:hypothetical protein V8C26DRAFT_334823 [Trichoderma gracile]